MIKKLFLTALFFVVLTSCEKKWDKTGHINPANPREFVVNDSISIYGSTDSYGDNYYVLFVNGAQVPLFPNWAWQPSYSNRADLVNTIQARYDDYLKKKHKGLFFTEHTKPCN